MRLRLFCEKGMFLFSSFFSFIYREYSKLLVLYSSSHAANTIRDRSVCINGYVNTGLSVACQISNFLFLVKILQITTKKTESLAVGLALRDRTPFLC